MNADEWVLEDEAYGDDAVILSAETIARAENGDAVAIELIARNNWRPISGVIDFGHKKAIRIGDVYPDITVLDNLVRVRSFVPNLEPGRAVDNT